MSRRRRPEKREILPDPRFGDIVLSKFMNSVMLDGKKSVAEGIVYGALESVETRLKREPIGVFHDALNNVKPGIEVRSRRVGGATYQVPVEVRPERAQALAIRWLITAARGRSEKTMAGRLSGELMDASQNRGNAVKKREDTPGHVDFTIEVERSLRVLDGAVACFDGVAGVEPQSETVWRQAEKYKVPRMCFVNKLDRTGANFDMCVGMIKDRLGARPAVLYLPIGIEGSFKGLVDLVENRAIIWLDESLGAKFEYHPIPDDLKDAAAEARMHLIEMAVEQDDEVMEAYLEGNEPDTATLKKLIRKGTLNFSFVPVLCGSAFKNKGVQPLLDAVVDYLPSPLDIPPVEGINPSNESEDTREASDTAPFSALAFKIMNDPFVGTLTFARIYSGKLEKGTVLNSVKDKKEKIGRMLLMHANNREDIDTAYAGDIVAIAGLKETTTGDTLCDQNKPIILERMEFPDPVIEVAVEPKTKADQEKMGIALNRLAAEDPSFRVTTDHESGQTIIKGMGELHLEILVDRMKREFKVEANVGAPQVAYRETLARPVDVDYTHKKQSGGSGQFGRVKVHVAPGERGSGVVFTDEIKGGNIPKEFIPSIEKGFRETAATGSLVGFPIIDFEIVLYDGAYHDVDSSAL